MSLDEKKEVAVEEVDRGPPSTAPSLDDAAGKALLDGELLAQDVRPAAERALVRTLDMRLLPTIILIYIMNYIDVSKCVRPPDPVITFSAWQRVAVSAARLKGLEQDLGLSGESMHPTSDPQ